MSWDNFESFENYTSTSKNDPKQVQNKVDPESLLVMKYLYFTENDSLGWVSYNDSSVEEMNSFTSFRRTLSSVVGSLARNSSQTMKQPLELLNEYATSAVKNTLGEQELLECFHMTCLKVFKIISTKKFKNNLSVYINKFFELTIRLILNNDLSLNQYTSFMLLHIFDDDSYKFDDVKRNLYKEKAYKRERSLYQHSIDFVFVEIDEEISQAKHSDDKSEEKDESGSSDQSIQELQYNKNENLYSVLPVKDTTTSLYMVKNIQLFGINGGFEYILEELRETGEEKRPSFLEIYSYIQQIYQLCNYLSFDFGSKFLPEFILLSQSQLEYRWRNLPININIEDFYKKFRNTLAILRELIYKLSEADGISAAKGQNLLKVQVFSLNLVKFALDYKKKSKKPKKQTKNKNKKKKKVNKFLKNKKKKERKYHVNRTKTKRKENRIKRKKNEK
eukprot:Anaeramoba_flamelloidesa825992_73.p1 GENE.a825992_73~~a825992_73.p1  ORF type:complete len:447 (+),score=87.54 a825992_73:30-1370(+)